MLHRGIEFIYLAFLRWNLFNSAVPRQLIKQPGNARINYKRCLSRGSRSLSAARQNGARTNKRALPSRGKRGKAAKARTFDAAGIPLRASRRPAPRHDAALWNFCGTAFFNWCNSNQPPDPAAPGALVKVFVAFSRPSCEIRRVPAFSAGSFALTTEKHSPRALLGRIKLLRKLYGIMPVLRRVTLSAARNLARGKSHRWRNGDIARADVSRLSRESISSCIYSFLYWRSFLRRIVSVFVYVVGFDFSLTGVWNLHFPIAKMRHQCEISGINEKRCPTAEFRSSLPSSLALGIMKSLAVGLTWPRIKFTSFQGCRSRAWNFYLLFFHLLAPALEKSAR